MPVKKLKDRARRKARQRQIMGKKETHRQEREQLKAETKRKHGKAAVKRVGEYKAALAKKKASKKKVAKRKSKKKVTRKRRASK